MSGQNTQYRSGAFSKRDIRSESSFAIDCQSSRSFAENLLWGLNITPVLFHNHYHRMKNMPYIKSNIQTIGGLQNTFKQFSQQRPIGYQLLLCAFRVRLLLSYDQISLLQDPIHISMRYSKFTQFSECCIDSPEFFLFLDILLSFLPLSGFLFNKLPSSFLLITPWTALLTTLI